MHFSCFMHIHFPLGNQYFVCLVKQYKDKCEPLPSGAFNYPKFLKHAVAPMWMALDANQKEVFNKQALPVAKEVTSYAAAEKKMRNMVTDVFFV